TLAAEQRSGDRASRDAATTRARLLVETLEGAIQGLRRELALPAVDVLPADTVVVANPAVTSIVGVAGPALRADDPALLDQLLALPRVHLVVDGYNVTKTGYPSLPLDGQRARLLRGLAPVVARTGAEVTVVFDGAVLRHPPPVAGPRGVRVTFSRAGQTADELIAELVRVEPPGRPVVVVSTDGEVAAEAESAGARAVPSATLLALLARG
ncbi:MAG: NYN domain-containing protein, partial [Actinomycetota bacterium]|nr:NYN domain-containing protein [Actinomycetota bacterium]